MEEQKKPLWTKEFVTISIINLFLFCGFQMLLPTLPLYTKALGGSDAILGWIIGAATVASLIIRPFSGIVIDRIGSKTIFIAGICIILVATLAYGWFPVVAAIIALRFLHGLGWGIATTTSSAIASESIPKHRFGEGMGYFSLSSSLAMALAPGIGLGVLTAYGFDLLSLVSTGFGVAALLLVFFINRGRKTANEGVKVKAAVYERASILPSVIMFFACATYGSITGFLSLYAADKGIGNIGIFFTVYSLFLLLSRPFYGRLTDRFGFNVIIYPGLILLIVALFLLSVAQVLLVFLISAAVYGMGFSAVQSSLQTMAIIRAPKGRLGAANATFFTGFDGGIGFGSVVGGMIASSAGYGKMYLYFSFFIVIAAALYYIGFTAKKQ